jgi:radical SAM protein with 4Fe4S-binding SPASM domain
MHGIASEELASLASTLPEMVRGYLFKRFGEHFFLAHPARPAWTIVNEIGFEIVRRCDGRSSRRRLIQHFRRKYGIAETTAQTDISAFIANLERQGFLQAASPAPAVTLDSGLYTLYLLLDGSCNLACAYCYLHDIPLAQRQQQPSGASLDLADFQALIDQFVVLGGKALFLSGGEPTLHPAFGGIVAHAASKSLYIQILSNGTTLTEPLIECLGQYRPWLQISLDGSCPEVNDHLRGQGVFARIMTGIRRLEAAGLRDRLILSAVVTRENLADIPNLIQLAENLGVPHLRFIHLREHLGGQSLGQGRSFGISTAQLLELIAVLAAYQKKQVGGLRVSSLLDGIYLEYTPARQALPDFWCDIGKQVVMDERGNYSPCVTMPQDQFYLGNFRHLPLTELLASPAYRALQQQCYQRRSDIPRCQKCVWKHFCQGGCPSRAYGETGSLLQPDSFCEARQQTYEDIVNHILKVKNNV